jgi:hypothetical protein
MFLPAVRALLLLTSVVPCPIPPRSCPPLPSQGLSHLPPASPEVYSTGGLEAISAGGLFLAWRDCPQMSNGTASGEEVFH